MQMKRKKIIWVDVGAHECQEFRSVFGSNFYFTKKLIFRRFSSLVSQRRKFISLGDLYNMILSRNKVRKNRKHFHIVCVEANHNLLRHKIYSEVDDVYCIALNKSDKIKSEKLYLAHNDIIGEGSSIFKDKENVNQQNFVRCIGIDAVEFARLLKRDFDSNFRYYDVVLRLNCEGVEDDVIYSFHKVFGNNLKLIGGSLADVEGVKGQSVMKELTSYLSENALTFSYFSGEVNSWPAAFSALKRLL